MLFDDQVLDGRPVYVTINDTDADSNLEAVGFETRRLNQLPLMFRFRAFHENRLPFTVRVQNPRHPATARLTLTSIAHPPNADDQTSASSTAQTGNIDVRLPDWSGLNAADVEPQEVERKSAPALSASRPGQNSLYDLVPMPCSNASSVKTTIYGVRHTRNNHSRQQTFSLHFLYTDFMAEWSCRLQKLVNVTNST